MPDMPGGRLGLVKCLLGFSKPVQFNNIPTPGKRRPLNHSDDAAMWGSRNNRTYTYYVVCAPPVNERY